jgi:hypothetical protein
VGRSSGSGMDLTPTSVLVVNTTAFISFGRDIFAVCENELVVCICKGKIESGGEVFILIGLVDVDVYALKSGISTKYQILVAPL